MATMPALVKRHAEPGLWLEEVPIPEYGINDVLIKVLRTGICGTDLHIYKWDAWAQRTIPVPMVVGHEFVGQIVELAVVRLEHVRGVGVPLKIRQTVLHGGAFLHVRHIEPRLVCQRHGRCAIVLQVGAHGGGAQHRAPLRPQGF